MTCLVDNCTEAFLDGVPGVGNVTDGVPRHGTELHDAKDDGQTLFAPPEGGGEGQPQEYQHENGGYQPCGGEHLFQLVDGAHQEESGCQCCHVAECVEESKGRETNAQH